MKLLGSSSRPRLAPFALLLLAGACASTAGDEPERDVNWLVRHGQFEEAVRLAADEYQRRPDDPLAETRWRLATVALLLDQGRRLSFQDRDVEALERFQTATELAPEVPEPHDWREATLDKLADEWVTKAIEWHAADNLPEASDCYERALQYRPEDLRAKEGLARVLFQLNYRRGMGEQYYEDGINALREFFLNQASHHFVATNKFDEQHERAADRSKSTNTLLAEERIASAEVLEEDGQFAAARNDYRLATLLDPEHPAAIEGLERAAREEQAAEFLRECQRKILRRDFDGAEEALAQGLALTDRQLGAFDAEHEHLVEARLMVQYESARALESDHRFEEAIESYGTILAGSPQGYFADVLARRDTLQDFVQRATEAYAAAQATDDPAQKLNLLRQVVLVYPEYRDAQSQLDALESALPGEPGDDGDSPR